MTHRYRRLATIVLATGSMCVLAACGSSSSSHSSSTGAGAAGTPGRHGVGLKLTASEQSCLKKHGVTLPTGGFGGAGGGRRGSFPKGGKGFKGGTPPKGAKGFHGTPPKGGFKGGGHGGFAQNPKRAAALKSCGVSFGSRPGGGSPPASAG